MLDFRGMNVRVVDGVLYLDGNISSSLRGEMVADQSVGVVGLLEVKNHLVGDDQLASDLALALGRDPRTLDLPIGVYPRLGVVRLSGAVHNVQEKAAAEEIARAFPGVYSVVNDLIVNPNAEVLNVMASSAGGEAEDSVPGKVYSTYEVAETRWQYWSGLSRTLSAPRCPPPECGLVEVSISA